jgi:hypothetical protein
MSGPATVTSAVICGGRHWTMRLHLCRLLKHQAGGAQYGHGIEVPALAALGHAREDLNGPVGCVRFRMVAKHNRLPALAVGC